MSKMHPGHLSSSMDRFINLTVLIVGKEERFVSLIDSKGPIGDHMACLSLAVWHWVENMLIALSVTFSTAGVQYCQKWAHFCLAPTSHQAVMRKQLITAVNWCPVDPGVHILGSFGGALALTPLVKERKIFKHLSRSAELSVSLYLQISFEMEILCFYCAFSQLFPEEFLGSKDVLFDFFSSGGLHLFCLE